MEDYDGVTTGRLEAFSDGVLAIAITLLVLDLHQPEGAVSFGPELRHQWPSFAAYVLTFLFIGVTWVNHHAVFRYVRYVDRTLLFLNLLLLLFLSAAPWFAGLFARGLQAGGGDARLAAALYGVDALGVAIGFVSCWLWITRPGGRLLHTWVDQNAARALAPRFGLGGLIYAATIVIAVISPIAALVVHFVIAGYYIVDQLPVPRARVDRPA